MAKTFSRQELYDLVWSDSMSSLSKKYDISDVGLRKMCERMDIPTPQIGYWNRIYAGRNTPPKPALPKNEKVEQKTTLSIRILEDRKQTWQALKVELENDTELSFKVPSILVDPLQWIKDAKKSLDLKRHSAHQFCFTERGEIDIMVSREFVDRALCFMDAFLKIAISKGFEFSTDHDRIQINLDWRSVKMSLREVQRRIAEPTNWKTLEPTGKLAIRIDGISAIVIQDGNELIEVQMSKLVAKLIASENEYRSIRLYHANQKAIQQEKERIEKEKSDKRKFEQESFLHVIKSARRWKEAQDTRHFLAELERKANETQSLTPELQQWLNWANKKTDWLDPMTEGPDEDLDGLDRNTFLNPPFQPTNKDQTNNYQAPYDNGYWRKSFWS